LIKTLYLFYHVVLLRHANLVQTDKIVFTGILCSLLMSPSSGYRYLN